MCTSCEGWMDLSSWLVDEHSLADLMSVVIWQSRFTEHVQHVSCNVHPWRIEQSKVVLKHQSKEGWLSRVFKHLDVTWHGLCACCSSGLPPGLRGQREGFLEGLQFHSWSLWLSMHCLCLQLLPCTLKWQNSHSSSRCKCYFTSGSCSWMHIHWRLPH